MSKTMVSPKFAKVAREYLAKAKAEQLEFGVPEVQADSYIESLREAIRKDLAAGSGEWLIECMEVQNVS